MAIIKLTPLEKDHPIFTKRFSTYSPRKFGKYDFLIPVKGKSREQLLWELITNLEKQGIKITQKPKKGGGNGGEK